jgi:hypothetical protein
MESSEWTIVTGCTIRADEWYQRGQDRLVASVKDKMPIVAYKGFPNAKFWKRKYNIKASCISQANLERFFWMDSSIYLHGDPEPIIAKADEDGYYFMTNGGFNCAQECSDRCLDYFKMTRDEAEKIKMCSSGFFAVDTERHPEIMKEWFDSCAAGVWEGSRLHDNQSSDPRFLHHRQDQSPLSILIHKHGYKMHDLGADVSYYPQTNNWCIHGGI